MESRGSVGEELAADQGPALALSWGELLWDLFPSGALLGGAPSNVVVHMAALGLPVGLITRVGRDELGERAQLELEARGVDTRALQWDEEMQTGRVGIDVVEGEPRYTLHPGAWRRIALDERGAALLRRAPLITYGTLSQEWDGLQAWRDALALLPEGCHRICDPNLRGGRIDPELVLEHVEAATVVKINDAEVEAFERSYGCKDVARWLLEERGVELVALTHGPAGATLISREERAHHPGFVAEPGGDNVGAGDGFVGALSWGLLHERPLEQIVELACRYGAYVASMKGATPEPSAALLDEFGC